jgi:hypothetical protein
MITVNIPKAIVAANDIVNKLAYYENIHRAKKSDIGAANILSDSEWANLLDTTKSAINSSTAVEQITLAVANFKNAIEANAL